MFEYTRGSINVYNLCLVSACIVKQIMEFPFLSTLPYLPYLLCSNSRNSHPDSGQTISCLDTAFSRMILAIIGSLVSLLYINTVLSSASHIVWNISKYIKVSIIHVK